jgi:hypothetical protein
MLSSMSGDWTRPPASEGRPPPPPPPPPPPSGGGYPPRPPGYGAPPRAGSPTGGGRPGGRRGLWIGLGVVAVVAVTGGVAAVALSGDDDGAGTATGPPLGMTLADLEPALLTEADVPSGFTIDEGDDGDFDSDTTDASDECLAALATIEESGEERDQISVKFSNDVDGLIQEDLSLAEPELPSLADTRAAFDQCDTVGVSIEGATAEFQFETSDVEGIGDVAMGLTVGMDMQAEGIPLSFDMHGVLWERDGVLASVSGFGGFDPSTLEGVSMPASQIEDLARTADQRLADALAG